MKVLSVQAPSSKTTQVTEGSIQVTLTLHEAAFLRALLTRVGGDPHTTPRCYLDNILHGLRGAGVPAVYEVFGGSTIYATMSRSDFDKKVLQP